MTDRTHRNALPEGYKLHWYRIDRILGEGGFGITYLATDTNLARPVAIKEYLPSDLAIRDADSTLQPISKDREQMYAWGLSRFHSEAKTLAKFNHPNVVRVYNVFEANNTAYMVMEFEHGQDLEHMIKTRQLQDEESILELLFPILDALESVHKTNIIHRDIKPANIYVRENGSPVLLDFGSARMAMGTQTRTLTSVVSPRFAPFEQYNPAGTKQGPWTDIYAMGATLYAIVTGRGPPDAIVRGNAKLEGRDTLKPALNIGKDRFSYEFLQAIDSALEFMPADRPQTIAEWRGMFPEFHPSARVSQLHGRKIPAELTGKTTFVRPDSRQQRTFTINPKLPIRRGLFYKSILIIATVGILSVTFNTWKPWITELLPAGKQAELEKQIRETELARKREENETRRIAEEKTSARNKEQFNSLMNEARLAMSSNDYHLAQKMLELAIGIYPNDMVAKLNLQKAREKISFNKNRRSQISELLSLASKYVKANKLTSPSGENAAERYQRVLEIEAGNVEAINGLKKIAGMYIGMATRESKNNRYDKALNYLSIATNILPESERFDSSRQKLSFSRSRINSRIESQKKERQLRHQADLKRKQAEDKRIREETARKSKFNRFMTEAGIAVSEEDKELATQKYNQALSLYSDDREAIIGLTKAKKMQYRACKEIVGEWLWSVGTTTVVRADGTCSNSFLFVSIQCTWSCTDGKNRKFNFRDQRDYTVTMSEDGQTLYTQGLTARRQKDQDEDVTEEEY